MNVPGAALARTAANADVAPVALEEVDAVTRTLHPRADGLRGADLWRRPVEISPTDQRVALAPGRQNLARRFQ